MQANADSDISLGFPNTCSYFKINFKFKKYFFPKQKIWMADPKLGPVQEVGQSAWEALQAWDAHGLFPLQYLLKPTRA